MKLVRNCPYDCPTIPKALKKTVAGMIEEHSFKGKVRRALKKNEPDDGLIN